MENSGNSENQIQVHLVVSRLSVQKNSPLGDIFLQLACQTLSAATNQAIREKDPPPLTEI